MVALVNSRLRSPRFRRRTSTLGDDQDVGILQGKANALASQLAQINQRIVEQGQQIVQLTQSGVDAKAEAAQLMNARNQFEDTVSKFTFAYRALFGSTPPGLSGLGIDPGTLLTVAAILAAVATAVYIIIRILDENDASIAAKQAQAVANQAQQQNIAYAQQQLAAAQASKDQAAAAQWQEVLDANQAYQTAGAGPGVDFFSKNWPWFLLGGGFLLFLVLEQ